MPKPAEYAVPEKIFAVCDELAANEINPTVKLVMLRLGGGSPNDIAPLLRDWKAAQAQKLVQQNSSSAIPEAVDTAMRAVWRVAEAEIRAQVEAADKATQTAQAERDEAKTQCLQCVAELKDRDATIAELKAELERLKGAAASHKDELDRAAAHAVALVREAEERHARQLKDAEAHAAARIAELQSRSDEFQRQLIEAKGQAKDSDAHRVIAEADAARLEKTLAATQKELAGSRGETAKLAINLAAANAKLDAALAAEKDLRASLKREEERCQGLEERLGELTKEFARIARAKADEAEDGGGSSSSGRKP